MAELPLWRPELERMAPEQLAPLELAKLKSQLEYLSENSDFYRRKLSQAGVRPEQIGSIGDVRNLPFTEKDELRASQEQHPPLGDYAAAELLGVVRVHSSSGTTGRPSYVGLTRSDSDGWAEMTARCLYAAGLRPSHTIAYAFNIGFFCGGPANIDAIQNIGATLVPIGTGASDRLVSAVQHLGVNFLTCTPSYAQYFAEHVRSKHGLDSRELGIRRLMVGGEPGGGVPSIRQKIQSDWDATAYDAMGSADLAPVFFAECEAQAGMHFMGQGYFLPEVVDPESGNAIALEDGAQGELVVTHLERECGPLLRFRTRDRVIVWTGDCSCGRRSFRLRCIGRTDDMLIVRGVNVFPSAVKDLVGRFRPDTTGEMVIELDSPGPRVDPPLRVVVEQGDAVTAENLPALAVQLESAIRDALVVRSQVVLVPPGSLPRSEMKSRLTRFADGVMPPP